jgi:hypothetical protein
MVVNHLKKVANSSSVPFVNMLEMLHRTMRFLRWLHRVTLLTQLSTGRMFKIHVALGYLGDGGGGGGGGGNGGGGGSE